MDFFSQFVGFIIVLFVLFFPVLRKFLEKKAAKIPSKPALKQARLDAIKKPPTFAKATKKKEPAFHYSLEGFKQKNRLEEHALKTKLALQHEENKSPLAQLPENIKPTSPMKKVLHETGSLKKLVIYHAIFGKPKGLRIDHDIQE